jgi:Cu(I)/Ag(I) efflux system periplasmic protein CusF
LRCVEALSKWEEIIMLKSKTLLAVAAAFLLANAAPAFAGMSGIEWMQKWQQLEKRQGKAEPQAEPTAVNVGVRVVKADVAAKTLTISHGAVKKIGMPAMTMTFPVGETTHLKMLHKGDHVTIHVVNQGGTATVTGFKMQH